MEVITSFMNFVAPPAILAALALFLPPFYLFKSFLTFLSSLFPEDMTNKVVLITGASSGIGEQMAYQYAKKGAFLVLVARREHSLREVAERAKDMGAPDVLVAPADVAKPEDCHRFIEDAVNRFGRLDHLVNNAGIANLCMFEEATEITNFTPVMQLAYRYAKSGAYLVLAARREAALKAVAKTAHKCGAPDVLVIPADISDCSESKRVIDEAIAHYGQLNYLVVNAGIFASCLFEEITDISAFKQVMDVNYWGSVYPTYYAIPYLKKSRGNIIVTASMAGRVPTARLSFYNASKAALIRFFETLRAELGSEVQITILTLGYVASELTKGKALQKGGEYGINEEVRDVQVGPLPVGYTEKCAEVVVDSACRGDAYVTWPSWYRPFHMVMCVAPELVDWFSRSFYVAKPGSSSGKTLSQKLLEATKAKKFLYPPSIRSTNTNFVITDERGIRV